MNTVLTIAGVLFASITAPLVLSRLNDRARRQEKQQDYERQDAVAKAAEERASAATKAAEDVAKQAADAAQLLLESNQRVARAAATAAAQTSGKLDAVAQQAAEIHTLVNSNMTAAMQGELDSTVRELAMMKEVIGLRRHGGQEPSVEALAAVEATESRVADLRSALNDRRSHTG